MLRYLDLNELKTKVLSTEEEMISKGVVVSIEPEDSIGNIYLVLRDAVKIALDSAKDDVINHFDIAAVTPLGEELPEDDFESVVNCTLTCFFDALVGGKFAVGRNRERRLDVPENLKLEVNCMMSALKRAINYQTKINRFQLTISSGELKYILVGDYDE